MGRVCYKVMGLNMGKTLELLKWYRKNYFENPSEQSSVQSELDSFFDVDDAIEGAIKKGEKNWSNSPLSQSVSLGDIKEIWKANLEKHSRDIGGFNLDSAISSNVDKGFAELDKVKGLSSEGSKRVFDRIRELVPKAPTGELAKASVSGLVQEQVNIELRKRASGFNRQDLLDLAPENKSLRKMANFFSLGQNEFRDVLEKGGFRVDDRGIIRR